jgi:multidrug efflux pump
VFSRFFIDRPIFASVMSIVITLTGAVAVFNLPLAQYPQITPPSIIVMCNYPGASAQVVAESVAAPIEQQVNGVEDMIYMSSNSANDGSYSLSVTFRPGVDLNFAQVLVQNRVNLALPLLPDVVRQTGLTTRKRNPDILLIVSLYSPKGRYDQVYLSNYATLHLTDEMKRVEGVGDVFNFGQQDYSMRIWVDPDRLASVNLTAGDVLAAVREQNQQIAAGHIGQEPTRSGQPFEFTITTVGRLTDAEQFEEIVLRTDPDGRKVYVRDVVSPSWTDSHGNVHKGVELGARSLDVTSKVDGNPCCSLAIFQLPYANALSTANRVRERMDQLREAFPEDMDYVIAFDTTPFISESITEVFRTLGLSIFLVAVVVLLFLQNWRSTIIPLTAVPVAIVGTFAVMAAIGFSINNLTLFGLVLAIGIVVDDAIVVVEAVEHHIEQGMRPRQAAHKAMEEVSGPVVAMALVLSAVFVPCAFISGITGQFFRQFALTIAVSTVISAFNSLTLSPALAAILLKPRGARKDMLGRTLDLLLGWFFRLFNWGFRHTTDMYTRLVALSVRGSVVVVALYAGLVGLTLYGFQVLPTGYIPNQDQSRLFIAVQLPDAASFDRTQKVVDRVAAIAHDTVGVDHTISVTGMAWSLGANGSNFGNMFVTLKDFKDRRHYPPDDPRYPARVTADSVIAELKRKLDNEVRDALTTPLGPPPVSGLGSTGGFKFIVEDRGDNGLEELERQTNGLIAAARPGPRGPDEPPPDPMELDAQRKITSLFTVFRANTPQLYVELDRDQCQTMGVNPRDVFTTLQVFLGSFYVNDFNLYGRTWQVVVQAEGQFRNDPDKVRLLKVRNNQNQMVPLGAVLRIHETKTGGPILIMRYNMYPAAAVMGNTAKEVSSGQGIQAMENLAQEKLPSSFGYEWTEINWIQIDAAKNIWNQLIFPLAVVFVFLVLAAQYESWALPLAVILVVPMCILGSLAGVFLSGGDINIFTQIGFVVLVGLASKNAILIVEFAKRSHDAGLSRLDAVLAGCRLRLRPILMTSFAFILGVVPLMTATGAGSEMRRSLGTAVFSGMLGVTMVGIFLTPVFFFVVEWLVERPLFESERARALGQALRYLAAVLTLGLLWLPTLAARGLQRRQAAAPFAPRERVPANGQKNGNGDGDGDGRVQRSEIKDQAKS